MAADLSGRGAFDIVVCNSSLSDPWITIITNNGSGTFTASERVQVGVGAVSTATGDLNGDGRPDSITAAYSDGALTVPTNDGHGRLQLSQSLPTDVFPHGVVAIDVNHDGWLDLVNCCWVANVVQTFTNDQHGHFTLKQSAPVLVAPETGGNRIDIFELDSSAPRLQWPTAFAGSR